MRLTLKKRYQKGNPDQTLYSFRHSGAVDIFKRTGSITKLQKAMGHSSINVSLTYLRGLEVPELTEGIYLSWNKTLHLGGFKILF